MFGKHRVQLTAALRERAVRAAEAAGYSSLDEFVAHAVEKELARLDSGERPDEAKEVEKQLRGLGYIE
jgi:hypothetical protein